MYADKQTYRQTRSSQYSIPGSGVIISCIILMLCVTELAAKSTDKKGEVIGGSNTVDERASSARRTDGVSVVPWSGRRRGGGGDNAGEAAAHLLSLMLDVTRQVSALHDAVTDMRQENKLNYRQLKRQLLRLSSGDNSNRPASHDAARQHDVHSGTSSFLSIK